MSSFHETEFYKFNYLIGLRNPFFHPISSKLWLYYADLCLINY